MLTIRKKSNVIIHEQDTALVDSLLQQLQGIPIDWKSHGASNFHVIAQASILFMKGQFKKAWPLLGKNLYLWQNNAAVLLAEPEFYLDALVLYIDTGILLGNFSAVLEAIQHPCNDYLKGQYAITNFEIIKFRSLNRIYNKTADYDNVNRLLAYYKDRFDEWINFSNNETKTLLSNSIGIAYFVNKKYEEAYYFLHRTIQTYITASRKEVQSFAYLFSVLICFEMGNKAHFESQYRNAYSFFYRHSSHFKFEKQILHTLHALFKTTDKQLAADKIKTLLADLKKTQNDFSQQFIFNIFNFPLWFESKLAHKEYRQMVKEKVAKVGSSKRFNIVLAG